MPPKKAKKIYSCPNPKCCVTFLSKKEIHEHFLIEKSCSPHAPFKCQHCNVGFLLQSYLDQHVSKSSKCRKEELECDDMTSISYKTSSLINIPTHNQQRQAMEEGNSTLHQPILLQHFIQHQSIQNARSELV